MRITEYLLSELLFCAAKKYPNQPVLIFPDSQLTYSELSALSQHYALAMIGHGLKPGDHVGILANNRLEYVALLFACMLSGTVAVLLNARFRVQELRHATTHCDLKWIFVGQNESVPHAARFLEAFPALANVAPSGFISLSEAPLLERVVTLDTFECPGFLSFADFLSEQMAATIEEFDERREALMASDLALIMFTSGTTSLPKGCMLTQESVFKTSLAMRNRLGLTTNECMWDPLPMFHMASILPLLSLFHDGGSCLTDEKVEIGRAVEQIKKHRATFLYPAFPAIMAELVNHPDLKLEEIDYVRLINNVGSAQALRENMRVWPSATHISAFGMTELSGIGSHTDPEDSPQIRSETCGKPYEGVEVQVVELDTGRICNAEEQGELYFRGFLVFEGYYKQPHETAKVIDDQGWFHTGDLGSLDTEGRIRFHGRIRDVLKVGGENVSPLEIEAWLSTHPDVMEAQVVGVPDERLDEVVAAFIQLKPGANLTDQEVIDYCDGQIASFKVPRVVRFLNEWPMSATKIQKSALREQLLAEPTGSHRLHDLHHPYTGQT